MEIDLTARGVRLLGAGGRVELGPALPGVVTRVGGRERRWQPVRAELDPVTGTLSMADGPEGLVLELDASHAEEVDGTGVRVAVTLRNSSSAPIAIERLTLLHTTALRVGEDARRWRTYRNGYQSWAGTRSLGTDERDADVPSRIIRTGVTDAKHPSPTAVGHVRSDVLSVIAEPVSGDALGIGFTDPTDAFGFVELLAPHGVVDRLDVWSDRDGILLVPGAAITSTVRLTVARGVGAGTDALADVVAAAARGQGVQRAEQPHPGGWCSWYYYFNKVTEADVLENLAVLAEDGRNGPTFACEYVMVDDGHQSEIGDWLDTDADQFPSGMAEVSRRIRAAGFDAGIWWAPFLVAPTSRIATEHPDWLVRNARGRPIPGSLNPMWSLRPMQVLDTTNPEVLDHLRNVARVLGAEWGYGIQKLDFLYAAALPGVRHDTTVTRARSLRLGLQAIRDGAGDGGFLLGCGSPFGPALGLVDAMRIGADVTPYWSNPIDRVGGRGRHGLATRNAVVDTVTRVVFDREWWLNDPDCLMVRDTDTKLTEEEVRLLATVIGITSGMLVISDRLSRLGERRRSMIARTRELAGGRVEVPDLFERALPELIVSRHEPRDGRGGRVDVGVLNLEDRARRVTVDLQRRGVDHVDGAVEELWTGAAVPVAGGMADLGVVPPHSARVLRIPT